MKKITLVLLILIVSVGLVGCAPLWCCCPKEEEKETLTCEKEKLILIAFERIVWAFPVGVEICYPPDVPNSALVRIWRELPPCNLDFMRYQMLRCSSYAILELSSGEFIPAIPISSSNLIGVEWRIPIIYDNNNCLFVKISEFSQKLTRIHVIPILW